MVCFLSSHPLPANRIGDLKLFGDLSQRRDKLEVDLPGLTEHFGPGHR